MREIKPGFGQVISGQCSYYQVSSSFDNTASATTTARGNNGIPSSRTYSPRTPDQQGLWANPGEAALMSQQQVEYPRVKRARRQLDLEGRVGDGGGGVGEDRVTGLGSGRLETLSPLTAYEPSFGVPFSDMPNSLSPPQPPPQVQHHGEGAHNPGGIMGPPSPQQQQHQKQRSAASGPKAPPPQRKQKQASGPKRGNYRCSKCGQLKKGHICPMKKATTCKTVPQQAGGSRNPGTAHDEGGRGAYGHLAGDQAGVVEPYLASGAMMTPPRQGGRPGGSSSPSSTTTGYFAPQQHTRGPGTPPMMTPPQRQVRNLTFTIARGTRIAYKSPPQQRFVAQTQSPLLRSPRRVPLSPGPGGQVHYGQAGAGAGRALHPQVRSQREVMDAWLINVFAKLDPTALLTVGQVCSHWRKVAKYVWNYVTDIKLEKSSAERNLPRVLWHARNLERLTVAKGDKAVNLVFKPTETPEARLKRATKAVKSVA